MSGIRQMYPLQWCDMGLIASGHKGGACAIVVLVSVDRLLVYREIVWISRSSVEKDEMWIRPERFHVYSHSGI